MADETPLWVAIQTVKQGLSANKGLEMAKELGIGIRRQDWLTLVRTVNEALDLGAVETMQPLDRRPFTTEYKIMRTATATGIIQYIDVWVKDRETGEIRIRPFAITSDEPMTRADAVATAIDRLQQSEDLYGERVLGGLYTATYLMVPRAAA